MEKKPSRNKAEVAPDENKAEVSRGDRQAMARNAAVERFAEMSDDEIRDVHAEGTEMFKVLNAEANKRGLPLGLGIVSEVRRDPAAGATVGKFTCNRTLQGDRNYQPGEERAGRVADFYHLLESGAISPADQETADAVKKFSGLERDVVAPTFAAPAEKEED